jgi:hypothetical protein
MAAAVKAVYGFRIKPGRFEDWRSMSREGEKLSTRHGAGQLRAMLPTAAGPESTMGVATIDFTSAEAWGTFLDATANEVESQVFIDRMFGHLDSPAEFLYSGLVTEIPLATVPDDQPNGPVLETYVTRPRPGRIAEAIMFGSEIAPMVLDEGARAVHLYVVGPAGSQTGTHAFVVEHADFASFGRMHDAGDKPEWIDVLQRATAPDSAFDMLQHLVMSEVLLH